ncbi:MAG: hypothetical protein N3A57_05730 [Negativicutes bacterium]|nr:hypothetical protein [Negativicutes bacterium]
MQTIVNCPDCGRMFTKYYSDKCPDCVQLEEAQFNIIREYLRQRGGKAKLEEIVEDTGVKEKYVMRMVRNRRLSSEFAIEYKCESCPEMITEGRHCKKCNDKLAATLGGVAEKLVAQPEKTGPRVHDKLRG